MGIEIDQCAACLAFYGSPVLTDQCLGVCSGCLTQAPNEVFWEPGGKDPVCIED